MLGNGTYTYHLHWLDLTYKFPSPNIFFYLFPAQIQLVENGMSYRQGLIYIVSLFFFCDDLVLPLFEAINHQITANFEPRTLG